MGMEKYGVDLDPEQAKVAEERVRVEPKCSTCGRPLDTAANVPKCPSCGTEPYEPKP